MEINKKQFTAALSSSLIIRPRGNDEKMPAHAKPPTQGLERATHAQEHPVHIKKRKNDV
ncbi:hypothetical protein [Collimonas silvisoli]|uniref:hypothetical protein n=1 Tax=Collimonas silvisoli TaxID=2825884 RepID=UPI001B8D3789|nr:hypothetical protein [Collimonas silvisoli]